MPACLAERGFEAGGCRAWNPGIFGASLRGRVLLRFSHHPRPARRPVTWGPGPVRRAPGAASPWGRRDDARRPATSMSEVPG